MARLARQYRPSRSALRTGVQRRRLSWRCSRVGNQRRELQRVDDLPVPGLHVVQPELRREEIRQCNCPTAGAAGLPGALHHRYL